MIFNRAARWRKTHALKILVLCSAAQIEMFAREGGEPNVESAIEHIAVAERIDALLVAPATADILAKFAHGIADDFLSTLFLATRAPVIVAPAMNVNMWSNPATQENLATLRSRGVRVVAPGSGYLAPASP